MRWELKSPHFGSYALCTKSDLRQSCTSYVLWAMPKAPDRQFSLLLTPFNWPQLTEIIKDNPPKVNWLEVLIAATKFLPNNTTLMFDWRTGDYSLTSWHMKLTITLGNTCTLLSAPSDGYSKGTHWWVKQGYMGGSSVAQFARQSVG